MDKIKQKVEMRGLVNAAACFGLLLYGMLIYNVDSGYSISALILFFASLVGFWIFPSHPFNSGKEYVGPVAALVILALPWILLNFIFEAPLRYSDQAFKILLMPAIIVGLIRIRPVYGAFFFFAGVFVASWSGFIRAFEQVVLRGEEKAVCSGHNMFGDTAVAIGYMACAALLIVPTFTKKSVRLLWVFLALSSASAAFAVSIMSDSRGGWLSVFAVLLLVSFIHFKKNWKLVVGVNVAAVLIISGLIAIPATGVSQRIGQASWDVKNYFHKDTRGSSLGLRFEYWKAGLDIIEDSPVIGHGYTEGWDLLTDKVRQGETPRGVLAFKHFHNEYIQALVERGLVGLIGILSFIFTFFIFFFRKSSTPDPIMNALSMSGLCVLLVFITAGFSNVKLYYNFGAMFFVFVPVILVGLISARSSLIQVER